MFWRREIQLLNQVFTTWFAFCQLWESFSKNYQRKDLYIISKNAILHHRYYGVIEGKTRDNTARNILNSCSYSSAQGRPSSQVSVDIGGDFEWSARWNEISSICEVCSMQNRKNYQRFLRQMWSSGYNFEITQIVEFSAPWKVSDSVSDSDTFSTHYATLETISISTTPEKYSRQRNYSNTCYNPILILLAWLGFNDVALKYQIGIRNARFKSVRKAATN